MKIRHWITAVVLLLLLAGAIVGMLWTRQRRGSSEEVAAPPGAHPSANNNQGVAPHVWVNQSPLQTARRIAALAYTEEEKDLARQVEKVADHEVDLAFFDAFRAAQENPLPLTPALKQLAAKKDQAQQAVKEDQDNLNQLKRKLAAAPESQKEKLQDQIDVAQAQLELDQDEQDDAGEALEQAGGDPQAEVQRLKQEHDDEEAHLSTSAAAGANLAEGYYQSHTLLGVFRAWRALHEKKAKLEEAQRESAAEQETLNRQHSALTDESLKESESRESARQQAKGFSRNSKASSREDSKAAAQAALDSLKHHRQDQKNLADFGKRVADEQKINDIYARWIDLVDVRQRTALHNMVEVLLWILLVLVMVYLTNRVIDRFTSGLKAENKRVDTLRAILKFSAQAVGAIAILFLIFGMPSRPPRFWGWPEPG
jgi:hypothetical protein